MHPTQHPSNNDVLRPPPGMTNDECRSIAITRFDNHMPGVWSYWMPTDEERRLIADGRPVRVCVLGTVVPPLALGVDGDGL